MSSTPPPEATPAPPPDDRLQTTGAELAAFIRRNLRSMVLVFLATIITAYGVISLLSDRYETGVKLLVKVGRETIDAPPTARGTPLSTGLRREDLASEIQILKSPDLAAEVIRELGAQAFQTPPVQPPGIFGAVKYGIKMTARWFKGLWKSTLIALGLVPRLSETDELRLWLINSLDVQPERESDVIAVTLEVADPRLGERILATWLKLYFVRRLQVRQSVGVKEFLTEEARQAEADLRGIEAERAEWKRKNALSVTAVQKELLLKNLRDLTASHNQAVGEQAALQSQIQAAQKSLASTQDDQRASRTEAANPIQQTLRERLSGLEAERAKLLARYEPGSERVHDLDAEISQVRALVDKEKPTHISAVVFDRNPLLNTLTQRSEEDRIRLEGQGALVNSQATTLADLRSELRALDEADNRLAEIERRRVVIEERYLNLIRRKNDADIASQLVLQGISNVSALGPPVSSIEPVYPRRMLLMGAGFLAAVLLAIGLALALEYLRSAADSEAGTAGR